MNYETIINQIIFNTPKISQFGEIMENIQLQEINYEFLEYLLNKDIYILYSIVISYSNDKPLNLSLFEMKCLIQKGLIIDYLDQLEEELFTDFNFVLFLLQEGYTIPFHYIYMNEWIDLNVFKELLKHGNIDIDIDLLDYTDDIINEEFIEICYKNGLIDDIEVVLIYENIKYAL